MIKKVVPLLLALLLTLAAFAGCADKNPEYEGMIFESDRDAGTCVLTSYSGSARDLTVPAEVGGFRVTSVGDHAFYGCSSLETVTLSEGITSVGLSAFRNCPSLEKVFFPASLTSIGAKCFDDCPELESVSVADENTVFSSDGGVLFNEARTELLLFPANNPGTDASSLSEDERKFVTDVASLEKYSVDDDGIADALYIVPRTVSVIAADAFAGNRSLEAVAFAARTSVIEAGAFRGAGIMYLRFPDVSAGGETGVTSIGEYAFADCKSLIFVNLPSGLSELGEFAFANCASLITMSVGGVERIPSHAFSGCSKLYKVVIGEPVKSLGSNAFSSCSKLSAIQLPGTVSVIGDGAFSGCEKLSTVRVDSADFDAEDLVIGNSNSSFEACVKKLSEKVS